MPIRQRLTKPEFSLDEWYSSDGAKRRLGSICKALNEEGETAYLLGSEDSPLLVLRDADDVEKIEGEIDVTIDEAKADWSALTAAALFYGSQFRIHGKRIERAVLYKHPNNEHSALKYRRSKTPDLAKIEKKLGNILYDIRKLSKIADRFDASIDIIDRRFREIWRRSQSLPSSVTPLTH